MVNVESLPEVFLSDTAVSYKVSRVVQRNQIQNITGKLYTLNMTDDLDRIIHRRIWGIVALLFPGAVIAERTAFELKPNNHKEIFIILNKNDFLTRWFYRLAINTVKIRTIAQIKLDMDGTSLKNTKPHNA